MKATALRLSGDFGIDALTFDTVDLPEPGPQQVLVAIRAVSLNYRDLMTVEGMYDPNIQKPRIPCSDGAGEVVAVGSDVSAFKIGDRVVAPFFLDWKDGPPSPAAAASALGGPIDGTLTTHALFPQHTLAAIPATLTFEEAATFPCAAVTAWHALITTANISANDTVLLLGTGGVSIVGLQIAKLRGARTIITSSSDEKLQRARALGADETINYKQHPEWDKQVRQLTSKQGVTHVLETGGAGTLPLSLRSAAIGAQVSLIGVLTGLEQPLNIGQILMKTLRVQGIYVGSKAMLVQALQAFADKNIRPVIDKTFSFADSKQAFQALKEAQHFGKLVITID